MKKLTSNQRQKQLGYLASMADGDIDTSDIPELTLEQLRRGVRGRMYRPIKKPVTMRLDADIIAWLKEEGRGYQTKANSFAAPRNASHSAATKEPQPSTDRPDHGSIKESRCPRPLSLCGCDNNRSRIGWGTGLYGARHILAPTTGELPWRT